MKDLKCVQNLDQGEEGESEHEGNPGSKDIVKYYRYYFVFLLQIIIFIILRMFTNTYVISSSFSMTIY